MKNLNGQQLAHEEIPKDIKFFNESRHEVQYLIHRNSSADDWNDDFHPIVCTHLGEPKAPHLYNDDTDMICTVFDLKSPKAPLIVSDFCREGRNINNRRKFQAPTVVVEADFQENFYSEIETDSEKCNNEVSDEDLVQDRDFAKSQEGSSNTVPSLLPVRESKETLKLTNDTLDCYDILVNQANESVLITVRSWISNSKLPRKDLEWRQCKGLLGYTNKLKIFFVDKKTQLVCSRSKHSPNQISLPQNFFIEAFLAAHDRRLSKNPVLKIFLGLWNDFSIGLHCVNGNET